MCFDNSNNNNIIIRDVCICAHPDQKSRFFIFHDDFILLFMIFVYFSLIDFMFHLHLLDFTFNIVQYGRTFGNRTFALPLCIALVPV